MLTVLLNTRRSPHLASLAVCVAHIELKKHGTPQCNARTTKEETFGSLSSSTIFLSSLAFIPAPTKSHPFVLYKASTSAGGTREKRGSSVLQCPGPVWPREASHIHWGQSQCSYVRRLETMRQGQSSSLVLQGLHAQPGLYQGWARCSERVKS